MYGADKGSGIITHLLINIFISQLLLSLFNIIILIPDNNREALLAHFITIAFLFFKLKSALRSSLARLLYLFSGISMFISFSSKLLKYISIAASFFLVLNVDFGLNLFRSNCQTLFHHFENAILNAKFCRTPLVPSYVLLY